MRHLIYMQVYASEYSLDVIQKVYWTLSDTCITTLPAKVTLE